MSIDNRIKVTDLVSLQVEKERLKSLCDVRRVHLEEKVSQFKKNYPKAAMQLLLPFNKETNIRISNALDWVNDHLFSVLPGLGRGPSGNVLKLVQAAVIFLTYRFAKKVFKKKKVKS